MNPFRVYIVPDYSGKLHIVFTKIENGKTYYAKKVDLVFEEVPEGSFFKEPTLEFAWHHSKDFLEALKEALDKEKLPEGRVEGELKATKYHLEDMRNLTINFFKNQSVNEVRMKMGLSPIIEE